MRQVKFESNIDRMSDKYKPQASSSIFPEEFRLEKLSKQGDPLERLNNVVEWEYFRATIEKMVNNDKMVNAGPCARAGRQR